MEVLANGFQLAEAPRPAPGGGLYFSDALGGGVRLLRPDGSLEEVVPKRKGVGGLVPHRDGGIVVSGRTVEHCRDGEVRTLLEVEGIGGFNDLTTDSEGRVIVGALRFFPFRGEEPVPSFVWRIENGEATLLTEQVRWPNGTDISPDGATLYMSDFADGTVHAFELGDEPPLPARVFARSPRGSADGLTIDDEGGVWIALGQGAGLARFTPDGELDSVVDIPDAFVTSLCFDGADAYVTTANALLRMDLGASGNPATPASV
jgi:sugar lactone lactonase YvrE